MALSRITPKTAEKLGVDSTDPNEPNATPNASIGPLGAEKLDGQGWSDLTRIYRQELRSIRLAQLSASNTFLNKLFCNAFLHCNYDSLLQQLKKGVEATHLAKQQPIYALLQCSCRFGCRIQESQGRLTMSHKQP